MRIFAVILLLLSAAAETSAQVVRGTVSSAETGGPLPGVFVILIDSAGAARNGVLTDPTGLFLLRAAQPGTFRLRADRIGHEPTLSEPMVLTADQAATFDLRLGVAPIELAPLEVATTERCETRGRGRRRTAQLWEETRKALSVARWVQHQKSIEFESLAWVRHLRVPSLSIVSDSVEHRVSNVLPYAAIPARTLTRFGFVLQELGNDVFYGPDAEVLLSDEFLEGHCFESVDGAGGSRTHIGLTFRPIASSKLPDIQGTLWLDARTLELRHIEYRYVNLTDPLREGAGGRTDFRRLPKGAWIVSNWHIRIPTRVALDRGRMVVRELRETGGQVTAVREAARRHSFARAGVITGVVHDSVRGRPLSDALVYLSGTAHQAYTDTAGRFAMSGVPAGTYTLAFTHPALDSMPAMPRPQEVQLAALDTMAVDLGTHSVRTQLEMRCPADSGGILFGYVRDETGTLRDALISATFKRYTAAPGGQRKVYDLTEQNTTQTARTDVSGQYLFCGLPLDSPIDLRVSWRDEPTLPVTAHLEGQEYRRLDLQLRH